MNKIYISIYFIVINLLTYYYTYLSQIYNQQNIWYMNLIFMIPTLIVSLIALALIEKYFKKVSISDVVYYGLMFYITTYIYKTITEYNQVYAYVINSNGLIMAGMFFVVVFTMLEKKFKTNLILKKLKIVAQILGVLLFILSIVNCFIRITGGVLIKFS